MPRPPRKKIPFQPTGTRVNVPANASSQISSKLDANTTRSLRPASHAVDVPSKPSPVTCKTAASHDENSIPRATGNTRQRRANAPRPSTGWLRHQSTSRIASSISPEESLVQEPAHVHDSLALDSSDTEASQLVERVNDSFTTAPVSMPLSRRPSMSRVPTVPPSAVKPQATPSFLGNFRRRARQPSILRMVQQQSETGSPPSSSNGDTTFFSLGQSAISPALPSSSRKRKRSSAAQADATQVDTPQAQYDSDNLPSDPADLPGATHPLQSYNNIQIPATAQDDVSDHEGVHDEPSLPLHLEHDLSPTPSTSPPSSDLAAAFTAQRRRARRATAQRSAISKPSFARIAKTPSAPIAHSSSPPMSPATSPLSLPSSSPTKPHDQQSRQAAAQRQKRGDALGKPLRTADLQSLLPQRRTRGGRRTRSRYADDFEIAESSSVRAASEDDEPELVPSEDEVVLPFARPTRRRTGVASTATAASALKAKPSAAKKARGQGKVGPTPLRGKGKGQGGTYSRRVSGLPYQDGAGSDCENEDDEDDENADADAGKTGPHSLDVLKTSAELQAAAEKFKEVDEWELSFESCDANGGGDSSPWR